jgi:nucleotide-binding universal stress UspA family protein
MVPLDGTQFAEAALPIAMSLARRDGLALQLVTVWQPTLPLYDTMGLLDQWEQRRRTERLEYMTEIAQRVEKASGLHVSVEHLVGRPGEVLPTLAELNGLDLVVMTTYGRGFFGQAALGSVADQVLRKGTSPLLLVRPDEELPQSEIAPAEPIRRILVPLDGSAVAETALQESVLTSPTEPTELILLRVLAFPIAPADREIVRAEKKASEAYLEGIAKRLASWNCKVITRASEEASPWTGIVDFAEANAIDLIAMTTHGRGGAAKLLLGSIANRVVRMSSVPVLLFHPEQAAHPWADAEQPAEQAASRR